VWNNDEDAVYDRLCLGLFDTCPCNATVPRVAQA
jgi:hypothetical protein